MKKGFKNFGGSAFRMNTGTSNIYSVVTITIESTTNNNNNDNNNNNNTNPNPNPNTNTNTTTEKDGEGGSTRRVTTLRLVDMAGSERRSRSGFYATNVLMEAKSIGMSMSSFGKVISALTDKKSKWIPYR